MLRVLCVFLALLAITKVQAEEYEEVSYDDLVRQLSSRRAKAVEAQNPTIASNAFDQTTLHAGVALVTTGINVSEATRNEYIPMTGFQLSLGIDLFSPYFVAEGAVRNFGTQDNSDQSRSFREYDMKVMYREPSTITQPGYRLGAGLATQNFTLYEPGVHIDESAPASIAFAAIEQKLTQNFGLAAELGYRSSLLSDNADRSSLDLMLRLDAFF